MSVVHAKIHTVEDMYRLIWTAISNRQPISAIYKELPRLFCPHRLGRNGVTSRNGSLRTLSGWSGTGRRRVPIFPTQRDLSEPTDFVIVSSPRKTDSRRPASSTTLLGTRLDRPPRSARPLVWTCPFQSALRGSGFISAPRMNISFK
jgi:hypothetical protein